MPQFTASLGDAMGNFAAELQGLKDSDKGMLDHTQAKAFEKVVNGM